MASSEAYRSRIANRPAASGGMHEWLLQWRDALLLSPRFHDFVFRVPGLRGIGRRRSQELFDICAGFVYSQTLLAAVKLDIFEELRAGPLGIDELARRLRLEKGDVERLLRALASLRLAERRSGDRYGLGELGAAFLANAGLREMVLHHAELYKDLSDPVSLLRQSENSAGLADYWGYGVEAAPEELQAGRTGKYSALMAATLPDFAREVLDAYDISQHKRMLDVGGGSGLFLQAAAKRSDALNLSLFDLPSVAEEARRKLSVAGLGHRSEIFTGSFKVDPLPKGADLVTFIRILLDHGDDVVEALLRSAAAAIAPGGRLLIAEAMSDRPGGSRVADAYFGFYLRAMGQGRARRPSEIFAMAERAGFRNCRLLPTRRPVLTQLIVANAPQ